MTSQKPTVVLEQTEEALNQLGLTFAAEALSDVLSEAVKAN